MTKKLRFQAAARIESDDVDGTASTFPPSFLPPPDDPTESPAQRSFMPKSASAGLLYDLPLGIVARADGGSTSSARPMPPSCSTRGRTTRPPPSRSAIRTSRSRGPTPSRSASSGRRATSASTLSVYHTDFKNFIYKRFTGAKCDDRFCLLRHGGTELDQIVYSQQDATFTAPSCWPSTTSRRIWHGVWGIEGQYDFVHAILADGTYVPEDAAASAGRRHLLSRHQLVGARQPAARLRASTSSPPSIRRRPATICSTPS